MPMSPQQIAYLNEVVEVKPGRYTRFDLLVLVTGAAPVFVQPAPAEATVAVTSFTATEASEAPTKDTLPWEEGDKPPLGIDVLNAITWAGAEAPKGKPSLTHMFEVLSYLRNDPKRKAAVLQAVYGKEKTPKLTKTWGPIAECVTHMPVFDSARWMFTVIGDVVTPAQFAAAFEQKNTIDFAIALRAWGLTMNW